MSSFKVIRVALFGEVSPKQLATLIKAGCELHSTDAPGDSFIRTGCHAADHKLLVHPAAWDVLDHATSKRQVKFNDDGTSREFNANGGFTRDAVLASSVAAVILGAGIAPSRRRNIIDAASAASVTVREIVPTVVTEYATPAEAADVINGLRL